MTADNPIPAGDAPVVHAKPPVPTYRERLLSFHRVLVEAESVTGRENDAGDELVRYLSAHGFVCSRQPLPPCANTDAGRERQNILAWPRPADGSDTYPVGAPPPTVLVSAHIDTVPPFIPYGIDAGPVGPATVIRGRGSVDAKAAVATQVVAVEELLAAKRIRPEDVMLLYVVGEEEGGDGMRDFSRRVNGGGTAAAPSAGPLPHNGFPAVIFGEPTDNKLACGHKGLLIGTITARGKAGHSGYPWLGQSANELLMRALVRAMDVDLGSSIEFGQTTLNVGFMKGGVAGNVIAEAASADVVLRVAMGPQADGHEKVKQRLMAILHEVDAAAFSVSWRGGYGAVPCYHDVPGTRAPSSRRQLETNRRKRPSSTDKVCRLRHHHGQLWHGRAGARGQLPAVSVRTRDHSGGARRPRGSHTRRDGAGRGRLPDADPARVGCSCTLARMIERCWTQPVHWGGDIVSRKGVQIDHQCETVRVLTCAHPEAASGGIHDSVDTAACEQRPFIGPSRMQASGQSCREIHRKTCLADPNHVGACSFGYCVQSINWRFGEIGNK